MRISDWSSDVCSSDLKPAGHGFQHHVWNALAVAWQAEQVGGLHPRRQFGMGSRAGQDHPFAESVLVAAPGQRGAGGSVAHEGPAAVGRRERKGDVEGKGESVHVDRGGSRMTKKKKNKTES